MKSFVSVEMSREDAEERKRQEFEKCQSPLYRRTAILYTIILVSLVWFIIFLTVDHFKDKNWNQIPNDDALRLLTTPKNNPRFDSLNDPAILKFLQGDASIDEIDKELEKVNPNVSTSHNINTIGQHGEPVKISDDINPDIKALIQEGYKNHAFNEFISNIITVKRHLPDQRDEWCKTPGKYLTDLPTTSVIICFYNEAWSTLLRTVHSVLDKSPEHLIKEIILVDDFSTFPFLKNQLSDYMKKFDNVMILRAGTRLGLARARLLGLKYSTAPTITFLDSHVECTEGWLQPLLDRVAKSPTTAVTPVIEIINQDTFEYETLTILQVGGFDWDLEFSWHVIPERDDIGREHPYAPVRSPTMAGGIFTINKDFFLKLGTYDSAFEIWGGENLELSFKIWTCGGAIELIPCSRVGHVFRNSRPYNSTINGVNTLNTNLHRVATVWMDDYVKIYQNRYNGTLEPGDVEERKALRKKLQCKPFKWYLENVYPDLEIPNEEEYLGHGKITNVWREVCPTGWNTNTPVEVNACSQHEVRQYWAYTKYGEIKRDIFCFTYGGGKEEIQIEKCHNKHGDQSWIYDYKQNLIIHEKTRKCVTLNDETWRLELHPCDLEMTTQAWKFENFHIDRINTHKTANKSL